MFRYLSNLLFILNSFVEWSDYIHKRSYNLPCQIILKDANRISDHSRSLTIFINQNYFIMKTSKTTTAKNAPKANANPLKGKVVAADPKATAKDPAPIDPEKQKSIDAANAAVEAAEKVYAEAKAAFSEAKQELRKLTGKKGSGPKGPGVISTILSLVEKSGKKGISKEDILKGLIETFPERAANGMEKTIAVQLPGRMSKEKGISIKKLETGCFYIAQ